MQQHSSPLHSPGPLLSHSPGPGSMLQHSPSNTGPSSNSCMSPHSLQASPRMGTPHSQVLVLHITVIYFEWYRAH
jgi:histone-lysine N-methyltransferase MLL3